MAPGSGQGRAPSPERARWRSSAVILALLQGLAGTGTSRAETAADAFGRWEQPLRHCRIALSLPAPAEPAPTATGGRGCERLRLDQQLEGVLVIRWLSGGSGSRLAGRQVSFAGLLDRGSPPMRCSAEGKCRPTGAMAVWLSAVAEAGFDPRTPAGGLPRTRLVQGLCRLEARHFQCEATESDGSRWWAEGRR